ncbi:sugar transporter [Palleronia sp. KMU-117]|uniref:sugar transporter n=1 Tax=Palleronia sp. KMU-117 TaxID=3434108 RepID=UPI003D71EC24
MPDASVLSVVPAPSGAAKVKRRHRWIAGSFLLFVVLPFLVSAVYLYAVARDQYASTVGFSVRTEDFASGLELLGGVAEISGGTSSDADILYEYIQSQELVQTLDQRLDLRGLYGKATGDPVFAFPEGGSIEDLVNHWSRMTHIAYDSSTGLIEVRALAFTAEDAQAIASAVLEESSTLVNELSAIARLDATRFAQEELDRAVERLKVSRERLTEFRSRTQIVDPTADIAGQMGLLNTLQVQLAEAYIQIDLLRGSTVESDPRIAQSEARIAVIEARIAEERRKFGVGAAVGDGGEDYATLISEFERLLVDREFGEQAYVAALAAYDAALAEARRQSRYLAPYIRPTLAESSQFPERLTLLALVGLFLSTGWAIAVLIYYSLRDRR